MNKKPSQIILIILILSVSVYAQGDPSRDPYAGLPKGIYNALVDSNFFDTYDVYYQMDPYIQFADFNGDDALDVALQIVNKNSQKRGILLLHTNDKNLYLIGAGKVFANLSDNFNWLNHWRIDSFTRLSFGSEALILTHPELSKISIYFSEQKYQTQKLEPPPNYSAGPDYGSSIPQLLLRLPGMYPHKDL